MPQVKLSSASISRELTAIREKIRCAQETENDALIDDLLVVQDDYERLLAASRATGATETASMSMGKLGNADDSQSMIVTDASTESVEQVIVENLGSPDFVEQNSLDVRFSRSFKIGQLSTQFGIRIEYGQKPK